MKLFAVEEELAELETRLPALHGAERLDGMVELSWHLRQRNCRRAIASADEAAALLAQLDLEAHHRTRSAARLRLVRGSIDLLFVRLDYAESAAREALDMFSALDDHDGMADAHGLLAMLANDRGDTLARMREWGASATHAALGGDSIRLDMAESEVARGQAFADVDAARVRWGARFSADQLSSHPAAAACVGDYLALVANLSSRFAQVVTYRMRVYDASLATGQVRRAIVCALNVGHAFINLSNPLMALEWVQRALDLARPAQWPLCLAMCHTQMAETLRQMGRLDEAKVLLQEALGLLTPLNTSRSYALALEHLAEVLLEQEQYEAAIEAFDLLEARAAALGQSNFLSAVRRGQAQALAKLGREHEALAAAGEALAVAHAQNDRVRQVNALRALAEIYSKDSQGVLPLPAGVAADGAPLHHLRLACRVASTIEGYSVSVSLLEALGKEYARVNNYPLAYNAMVQAAETRQKINSAEAATLAVAMHVQRLTEERQLRKF